MNPKWKCSFHEKKGHITKNCQALKVFFDQLVWDGHLKEFVDEENTRAPNLIEAKKKTNKNLDKEEDEDLPLGTIHMIRVPNNADLVNRIWGEILQIK